MAITALSNSREPSVPRASVRQSALSTTLDLASLTATEKPQRSNIETSFGASPHTITLSGLTPRCSSARRRPPALSIPGAQM
ncbi:MAG: hypothetical protein CXX69_04060 [Candidatus Thalassarchaeum betae]|uniref:Uncharacterized protein n=1 Tax=Candidatus Thalassarchaeum betae TaxID=2599289 RepID=A0A2V3HQM8_9ARCH|nr:MAG: hypothetical protein CXX69_04060 [Candidatus Thalassoarchaea betae]